MSGAQSAPVLPFAELIDELRRHGFVIGLEQHLRMQRLLDQLADSCPPERLKTHLGPIFATSREEQERFHRIFDRLYPVFGQGEREAQRRESGQPVESLIPPRGQPARDWRRFWIWVGGLALLAMLGIGLWLRARSVREPAAGTPVGEVTVSPGVAAAPALESLPALDTIAIQPTPKPEPAPAVATSGPEGGFLEQHRGGIRLGAIALVLLLFVINEWRLYRRRRLVVSRERRHKPPFTWPVRLEAPTNPFAESADLPAAARLLRQRELGEVARLSVEETVTATIAALGFPTFRYRTDTRAPDYLLLIERSAFRDHGARLYQALARSLEREGVHVTRYLHDGDPRVCYSENGEQRELLVDLRRRFPDYRLLLFSNGQRLVDQVTGRLHPWTTQFLSWSDRALLTPESPAVWGLREVALAQHFVVLPASTAGLMGVVGHFRGPTRPDPNRWRGPDQDPELPPLDQGDSLARLQAFLGPRVYRWLCACAVYPELHWDLTLHFGTLTTLGPGLISEENLLRLLRLPWFRQGAIPDEIRARLIDELTEAEERAVREAIVELLERNPAPGDSVSANRYELDLVVQRLALHRSDPQERRAAMRDLAGFPRRELVQDFAMLKLIEETPATRLQVILPRRLRRMFYRDGVPALGTRTVVRAGGAAALIAGAIFLTRAPEIDLGPVSPHLYIASDQARGKGEIVFLFPDELEVVYLRDRTRVGNTLEGPPNLEGASLRVDDSDIATVKEGGSGAWYLRGRSNGTTVLRARSENGERAALVVKVDSAPISFEIEDSVELSVGTAFFGLASVPAQGDRRVGLAEITVQDTTLVEAHGSLLLGKSPGRTTARASLFGQERNFSIRVVPKGGELTAETDSAAAKNRTAIEATIKGFEEAIAGSDLRNMLRLYPDMPPDMHSGYAGLFASRQRAQPRGWKVLSLTQSGDSAIAVMDGKVVIVNRAGTVVSQDTAFPRLLILERKNKKWVIARFAAPETGEILDEAGDSLRPLPPPGARDFGPPPDRLPAGFRRLDSLRALADSGGREPQRRYFAAADSLMIEPTLELLQARLMALSPDTPGASYSAAYLLLKTYLATTAYPDKASTDFVGPVLLRLWNERPEWRDRVSTRVALREFRNFSFRLSQGRGFIAKAPDSVAITHAREVIAQLYLSSRDDLYGSLLSGASSAPNVRSFQFAPGPALIAPYTVLGAFTRQGWDAMQSMLKATVLEAGAEEWVLGNRMPTEQQRGELAARLQARYRKDYVERWQAVVSRARIAPFTGLRDGSEKFLTLASNGSPLIQLANAVAINTSMDSAIASRFTALSAFAPPEGGKRFGKLAEPYQQALVGIGVALERLSNASDPNREAATQDARNSAGKARAAAVRLVNSSAESDDESGHDFLRLLLDPVERVEPLLSGGDARQLNAAAEDFCRVLDPLLAKLPFNPDGPSASLDEVNAVFHPTTGALGRLLDDQLHPYLRVRNDQLAVQPEGGLSFNPRFVASLQRAVAFSRSLYPEGQPGPRLGFAFRSVASAEVSQVSLTVDGATRTFSATRTGAAPFEWIGIEAQSVSLTATSREQVRSITRTGTWALFRLFAEATSWHQSGRALQAQWMIKADDQEIAIPFELSLPAGAAVLAPAWLKSLRCERQVTGP